MDAELADICQFLAEHAPFDQCSADEIEQIARQLSIRYLRHGSPFPPAEDAAAVYLFRTGAAEFRDDSGQLLDRLHEGELFADPCLDGGLPVAADGGETGHFVEDSLVYVLPCEKLAELRVQLPALEEYFAASTGKRLREALRRLQGSTPASADFTRLSVRDLLRGGEYGIAADASIRDAAQHMMDHKTSGVLVMDGDTVAGLVTDHDLRKHCVIGTVAPEDAVRTIMTTGVHSVAPDIPAFQALLEMTRRNIRHLPVIAEDRPLGLITAVDFIRQQSTSAVYLVGDIQRCDSLDAVARVCEALPEVQIQLVSAGAHGSYVQEVITSIADAATRRIIELVEDELGTAPLPYAWVAVGSQSRHEMSISSDQDNMLLIDDAFEAERHDEWFSAFAEKVNQGLAACGFRLCPGEVMARNPHWRQPQHQWLKYFHRWIEEPESKSLMYASNFFDLRLIHGEAALLESLRTQVLKEANDNRIFQAHLAGNALKYRPPLGVFRGFVLTTHEAQEDTLDLKANGLVPIVDIARLYTLTHGIDAVNTLERLQAASEHGVMNRDTAQDLANAYEFIASLRLRHQVEAVRRGDKPDNYLDPRTLSSPERSHLKQAFRVVRTVQQAMAQRYQGGRFA
jgi:CBS domain-containing protein